MTIDRARLSMFSAFCIFMGAAQAQLLEEVVVTAQKREQAVTDVSQSVSALTSDTLRTLGVSEIRDLDSFVPNLDIKLASVGTNPVITVRGVGLNNFNSNNNPTVGVYVDEVGLSSPAMLELFVMDLERVEILKGPQGTLYGRNSNGGAINIHSAKPTQVFEGYTDISVGSYESFRLEGAVSGGLTDQLAGRISVLYDRQGESFYNNFHTGTDAGDADTFGIRTQLSYGNHNFDANLSLFYFREDRALTLPQLTGTQEPTLAFPTNAPGVFLTFDRCAAALTGFRNVNPGQCTSTTLAVPDPDPDPFTNGLAGDLTDRYRNDSELYGGNLRFNYDIADAITLTSVTGYISQDRLFGEGDGTTAFFEHDEEMKQFSQELRLSGDFANASTWIVGAFYHNDEVDTFNPYTGDLFRGFTSLDPPLGVGFDATPLVFFYDQKTTAYAAFASVDWVLADTWTLVAGVRYSSEEIEYAGGNSAIPTAFSGLATTADVIGAGRGAQSFGVAVTSIDRKIDENSVSGRVALEYRPNDDWLFYGSAASGFKSGGFLGDFTFSNEELEPFDSESLMAYELGAKATVAGGLSQVNVSVFYYDYEDIQTLLNAPFGIRLGNVEQADVYGLDVEIVAQPVDGLNLSLGLGWLDTEISTDQLGSGGVILHGNELPNSPELSVAGLVRYEFPVSDALYTAFQFDFKYQAEKFTEATNNPLSGTDDYLVTNARISVLPSSGQWEAAVWVRNLFDKEYFEESIWFDNPGNIFGFPGAPRTLGVSLNYYFGN